MISGERRHYMNAQGVYYLALIGEPNPFNSIHKFIMNARLYNLNLLVRHSGLFNLCSC